MIEREAQERVARYAAEAERTGRSPPAPREVPDGGWFATPDRRRRAARRTPPCCTRRSSARCWPSSACATSRTPATASTPPRTRLTGGLFARNPDTVDYVVDRTPVGNLYVNRSITGAMVGRQPFGGNRLSGTGTKAGGPGYLLQFVEPRVVTENTMRHGLVV